MLQLVELQQMGYAISDLSQPMPPVEQPSMPAAPDLTVSPGKPNDIVDRDAVWKELAGAWQRDEPALLIGLGRRRAGKSFVLARFAQAVDGVYYQATKRTEAEQISALSRIVGQRFQDRALMHGTGFSKWEDLFEYMTERAAGSPFLLILDEFPYLADAAKALPSILQHAWDHLWPNSRVRLVLNGSHISAMERLEAHDQPLYGRRTARVMFPPLTPDYVRAFVPMYTALDVIQTYAIFGGLPGYLALLRRDEDLAANVQRLILDPNGRLADDAQHVLDAFMSGADIHYSIIEAIAAGERAWGKITSRLGISSGSLSRPMRWLEDMRVVSRKVPITENAKTSKRSLYTITDPYLSFWHRFVAPLVAAGETSVTPPDLLWEGRVLPSINDHMGHQFEEVCRKWVARTSRLPFRPTQVGSWWDSSSQNEIDLVAIGPNGEVLIGECKWGTVDGADLNKLRERAILLQNELPARARTGAIQLACFSARGEWAREVEREMTDGTVLGFTAEDVLGT